MRAAFVLILLLLCSSALEAYAHGGRTNSAGCHNTRKTGGYHCHGKNSSSSSSYNKSYKSPSKSSNGSSSITFKKSYNSPSSGYSPNTQSSPSKSAQSAFDYEMFHAQTLLNKLSYSVGRADGIYGPKTKRAIEDFQRDHSFRG